MSRYHCLRWQTDQVACFDGGGRKIDCLHSGQDGEFNQQKDCGKRFRVSGGQVEDTATGLIWTKNANPAEFPMSWPEAFDFVDRMTASRAHGIQRWRLPSRRELYSLISHRNINPSLPDHHPFENCFPGYYWSRTPCARLADQAWYVHFGGARVQRGMQHGSYMVWPVAGPELDQDLERKSVSIQREFFSDGNSGKTWYIRVVANHTVISWEDALQLVHGLNREEALGYRDWRLPNIRELEDLVDLDRHSPAFPAGVEVDGTAGGLWSSTTSEFDAAYAWVLYPQDGAIGVGYKRQAIFSAWATRG